MSVRFWARLLAGALTLSLWPWAASSDYLGLYEYTVLRDGDPIGTYKVTVTPENDSLQVEASSQLEINFGPLTLYRFEHQRSELWRDGELETMVAWTDKNGDLFDISISKGENGYTRVINGRVENFDPSTRILALWHEDLFKYNSFLSPIEDRTYQISVDYVGEQEVELIKGSVDARFYRMTGDTERDIYYDSDGNIIKVRLYDHRGAVIEYVLNANGVAVSDLPQISRRPSRPAADLQDRK